MKTDTKPNPNLRAVRRAHNLTQQEVADKIGVAKATICIAETRSRGLGRKKWYQLADIFNIDPRILEGHLPLPENYSQKS